jgi:zinc transport system permease protein
MIAIPVATALQFNKGFKVTLLLAILIGFIDVISSVIVSFYFDAAPGGLAAIFSVFVLVFVICTKKIITRLNYSSKTA